jgi:hypothetical protein
VAQISGTTLGRWLSQDALEPWRHRCWIFPRDAAFATKAVILDLYQGRWEGKALGPRDYVLCAKPFEWTFTRSDLDALLENSKQKSRRLAA